MNLLQTNGDWLLSWIFISSLFASLIAFKYANLKQLQGLGALGRYALLAPVFSYEALQRSRPATPRNALLTMLRIAAWAIFLYLAYYLYRLVAPQARACSELLLSYLAIPIVYGWGEVASPATELICYPLGKLPPPTHRWPFAAANLTEFWGSRWNTWVRDIFYTTVLVPLRRQPRVALAAVFLVSGFLHELVINLPYYVLDGVNLFGSQMAYFGLQGLGVYVDRKYGTRIPISRRALMWAFVVIPAPLIVNEALLRILHLW